MANAIPVHTPAKDEEKDAPEVKATADKAPTKPAKKKDGLADNQVRMPDGTVRTDN